MLASSMPALGSIVRQPVAPPDEAIEVAGHTDSSGIYRSVVLARASSGDRPPLPVHARGAARAHDRPRIRPGSPGGEQPHARGPFAQPAGGAEAPERGDSSLQRLGEGQRVETWSVAIAEWSITSATRRFSIPSSPGPFAPGTTCRVTHLPVAHRPDVSLLKPRMS